MSQVRRGRCLIAAALLLVASFADAQRGRIPRVAYIDFPTPEGQEAFKIFRVAMRELGYVEGRTVVFDSRIPDLDLRQVPTLVDELIASKPDVLLGNQSVALAMRAKTTSIPIVLTHALDPVSAGLALSLRRPGLNVTGSAQLNDLLPAKHIDILRQILPRLNRVGQLVDTNSSGCKGVEKAAAQAAKSVGATLAPYFVADRNGIEQAFSQMQKVRPDALLPCPSAVLFNHREFLIENAIRLRIPLTSFVVANVPTGVLFAYAAGIGEMHHRAATYVDKILKGAKPGDLPIEQPTKFELVINLKTAKALGIKIPQSVLLRADRVIE